MDKLEIIMNMQKDLQKRLGTNFSEMTLEERAAFMRNHRGYLEDELAEALYEMPNYKLWKDYSKMSDEEVAIAWQKVRMELIDSLHFFVNLLLCAGMTAEEVCDMYMAKNKENHRRQDAGYTADVSYREQAVEDVMKKTDASTCTVIIDGKTYTSNTFVAILNNGNSGNNEPELLYHTNALFMKRATSLLTATYKDILAGIADRELVEALGEVL